jgi:hypothetical protein
MSRTVSPFRQSDVTRALKALHDAGMDIVRDRLKMTVNRYGVTIEGKSAEPPPQADNDGKEIVL